MIRVFQFFIISGLLFGQVPAEPLFSEVPSPEQFSVFKIGDVSYQIRGSTWELSLKRLMNFDFEKKWTDWLLLEAYLDEKKALLYNNRIFSETSFIYSLRRGEDGVGFIDIKIDTKDSWNILALPIPKYSDSEGLNLSLRIRDNNFLGTMEQLRINLEYKKPSDGTTALGGSIEIILPFLVGGDEWFFSLDGSGFYKSGGLVDLSGGFNVSYPFLFYELPWTYSLGQRVSITDSAKTELTFSSAISVTFPIYEQKWTLTPSQAIKILTDYADADGYYATTRLDFSTSIPTGWNLPGFGLVNYNPGFFTYIQYLFERQISFARDGLYVGTSQGLVAGRWDWVENFRRGTTLSLTHSYYYNFTQVRHDNTSSLNFQAFGTFADVLGFSFRALANYQQNSTDTSKMEPVRGVIDSSVVGNFGLYANLDLVLKVMRITNFQDLWGWNWMKIFNFEMQFSLFTDAGYILPQNIWEWVDERLYWTAGAEIIGYPLSARSYFMRLSYGINLRKMEAAEYDLFSGLVREIFIGLGHHY